MVPTSTDLNGPNVDSSSETRTEVLKRDSGNLAFVLREKRHFYYETRPMPTFLSENHVIIAVCATGLCGSDVCTCALQHRPL